MLLHGLLAMFSFLEIGMSIFDKAFVDDNNKTMCFFRETQFVALRLSIQ